MVAENNRLIAGPVPKLVRDITPRPFIPASREVISSVIPSAK